jgi:hypothetical protein
MSDVDETIAGTVHPQVSPTLTLVMQPAVNIPERADVRPLGPPWLPVVGLESSSVS